MMQKVQDLLGVIGNIIAMLVSCSLFLIVPIVLTWIIVYPVLMLLGVD